MEDDPLQNPVEGVNQNPTPKVLQNVPFPEKLRTTGKLSINWKRFERAWKSYEVASRVKEQPPNVRAATLNACLGEDAQEILEGLAFENDADREDADKIITVLRKYCLGEANETYERYTFFTRDQEQGEKIDHYVAALRSLSKTCNFGELEGSLIRDRLVTGVTDTATRKKLLTADKLTLKKSIDICRSMEATEKQLQSISENKEHAINKVATKRPTKGADEKGESDDPSNKFGNTRECKFCGKQHVMKKERCPAWGKTCSKCKGKNHFAAKCRSSSKRIHAVAAGWEPEYEESPPEIEEIDHISTNDENQVSVNTVNESMIYAVMKVNQKPVKFQLDTGASVNLINQNDVGKAVIRASSKTLLMWNKAEMKPIGECKLLLYNPKTKRHYLVNFIITDKNLTPILGAKAIQKMHLITVNKKKFHQVASIKTDDHVIDQYATVFNDELGQLPGVAHFEVDETITPVVSPTHSVPVALKPQLKKSLEEMVAKGIIAPVEQPTDWVNNIVLTKKKSGELRVCIDPRPLNKALKRERYELPVLNDMLPELSKAKVFSTFDLKAGYWHVSLDEESSLLTTFSTPFGRFRWLRLPFGTCVSSEIFQKRLYQAIGDIEGVLSIADDILVFGVGDSMEEAIEDHDQKSAKLLQR